MGMAVALECLGVTRMPPPVSFTESLRLVWREVLRAPWACLSALRHPDGAFQRRTADAGGPVVVLGGFLSPPMYYTPLGRVLARRGYAVHFDEGLNAKPIKAHVNELCERLEGIAASYGGPVQIVGHSLGGLQAMAVLLERPDLVGRVVAVASPVMGGTPWRPLQRLVERVLRVRPGEARLLECRVGAYGERITTISWAHDVVAPPESCAVPGATNVIVRTLARAERTLASHAGVIFMRGVLRVVLDALAAPSAVHAQSAAEPPAIGSLLRALGGELT